MAAHDGCGIGVASWPGDEWPAGSELAALIADRDRRFGIDWRRKRQNRADIPMPKLVPGANSWESGRTVQTRLEELEFKR